MKWCYRSLMNPADYVPAYDDSVKEFYLDRPDLGIWIIKPMYCLMPPSAWLLASLFDPSPTVVMLDPWVTGGFFRYNHPVPWLKFPDGKLRNAALLASYWGMAGVPGPRGGPLEYAKWDVATWIPGDPGTDPGAQA
jgi:hypothetical protein